MQQTSLCTTCGAEILSETRFCRKCGQPSSRFDPQSVTEGTTRLLETPERPVAFDQHMYEQPGGLAQQTSRISPQANPTNRILETSPKPENRVLIVSILVASVLLAITVVLIATRNRSTVTVTPPTVTRPGVPPVLPPPPPPAPPRGITLGSSTISRDLIYPGAQTTMEMTDASEGNVLQLQTEDSFEKVVDWYKQRVKPKQVIRAGNPEAGGEDSNVILNGDRIQVIINAEDDKTNILLHQGGD